MAQTRLHTNTTKDIATKLQQVFEFEFEEDGFAISSFEIDEENEVWEISIYCDDALTKNTLERMNRLTQENNEQLNYDIEELPDIDWVAQTLSELSPIRVGRFIVHGSHDKNIPKSHEHSVLIDAGLAFGTGHHGTTAGCLHMLDKALKKQKFHNILDLGTGSGVLAIAAAKTCPGHVIASDIDPVATQTALDNCKLNGVQAHMECLTSTGFTNHRLSQQAPYDLILANILARPLQQMSADITNHTARGGVVILSGLLPHQRAPIVAHFRLQGLHLEHYLIRDNWLVLSFRKP